MGLYDNNYHYYCYFSDKSLSYLQYYDHSALKNEGGILIQCS